MLRRHLSFPYKGARRPLRLPPRSAATPGSPATGCHGGCLWPEARPGGAPPRRLCPWPTSSPPPIARAVHGAYRDAAGKRVESDRVRGAGCLPPPQSPEAVSYRRQRHLFLFFIVGGYSRRLLAPPRSTRFSVGDQGAACREWSSHCFRAVPSCSLVRNSRALLNQRGQPAGWPSPLPITARSPARQSSSPPLGKGVNEATAVARLSLGALEAAGDAAGDGRANAAAKAHVRDVVGSLVS